MKPLLVHPGCSKDPSWATRLPWIGHLLQCPSEAGTGQALSRQARPGVGRPSTWPESQGPRMPSLLGVGGKARWHCGVETPSTGPSLA